MAVQQLHDRNEALYKDAVLVPQRELEKQQRDGGTVPRKRRKCFTKRINHTRSQLGTLQDVVESRGLHLTALPRDQVRLDLERQGPLDKLIPRMLLKGFWTSLKKEQYNLAIQGSLPMLHLVVGAGRGRDEQGHGGQEDDLQQKLGPEDDGCEAQPGGQIRCGRGQGHCHVPGQRTNQTVSLGARTLVLAQAFPSLVLRCCLASCA